MKIDPTKLLMVYSAVLTVGAVGVMSTGGAVAQSGGATTGKASFDTICHEHLEYYSLAVL